MNSFFIYNFIIHPKQHTRCTVKYLCAHCTLYKQEPSYLFCRTMSVLSGSMFCYFANYHHHHQNIIVCTHWLVFVLLYSSASESISISQSAMTWNIFYFRFIFFFLYIFLWNIYVFCHIVWHFCHMLELCVYFIIMCFEIWNKFVCHLLSAQKLCFVYYHVWVCKFNEKLTKTVSNVYESTGGRASIHIM